MAYDYRSLPRTQVSSPRVAQILRRYAMEAIRSHGFIINVYPLLTPNYDDLYGDRYEKGVAYGPPTQMLVAVDWPPEKDLLRYIALYNEKNLPLPLYTTSDTNFAMGTKIEFPYNVIDVYSFTNTFKLVNQTAVGGPYMIMSCLQVVPQRF